MEFLKELLASYGATILSTIVTCLMGYITLLIKTAFTQAMNDSTKRSVIKTCVKAVEQLYSDLNGAEKFNRCVEAATSMLNDKGINITEGEMRLMIESAVHDISSAVKDDAE